MGVWSPHAVLGEPLFWQCVSCGCVACARLVFSALLFKLLGSCSCQLEMQVLCRNSAVLNLMLDSMLVSHLVLNDTNILSYHQDWSISFLHRVCTGQSMFDSLTTSTLTPSMHHFMSPLVLMSWYKSKSTAQRRSCLTVLTTGPAHDVHGFHLGQRSRQVTAGVLDDVLTDMLPKA